MNLKEDVKKILKNQYPLSLSTGTICRKLGMMHPDYCFRTTMLLPKLKKWSNEEEWIDNRGKIREYFWKYNPQEDS